MNIRFLHKQGHSVREIARLTGHARNTVRKLLRATPPGEQAQCDWAEVGRYPQPDGTSVRVYAFVMVLG